MLDSSSRTGEATILIRIDDFPTGIRPKLDNYRDAARQVLDAFEDAGLPYVLGVVPQMLEPEDDSFLQTLRHATIAMHGLHHGHHVGRFRNEFTGRSVNDSVRLLQAGLKRLEKFEVASFIPPGNGYDMNLLRALKVTGFSVCFGSFPRVWRSRVPIPVLHTGPPLYGRSREILNSLIERRPGQLRIPMVLRRAKYEIALSMWNGWRQSPTPTFPNVTQLALHWTWEWDEIKSGVSRLNELCSWLSKREVVELDSLFG